MSSLHYGVLGPVEVRRGDDPVHLPTGHQRAVLARLLIARGRPVSTDALVDAAWPSALPTDPRGALHTVLSRLRASLGDGSVVTVPGGYALRTGPETVDAERFEQLRGRARSAPPAEAADLLGAAVILWRGPAYADHADQDFATAEAVRLERLRLDTVEGRAAALLLCAEHGEAAEELAAMLDEDPFRERAVELRMNALYGAGRPAEALACFRTHRDRLAAELGLDPAPSLVALHSRILGHEMPTPAPAALPAPVTWADTSTSFLGREREIAELARHLARHRLVAVTGVGGVGKTRLVAEALPHLVGPHGPATVVELATAEPGQLPARVARALGVGGDGPSLFEDIVEFLSITRLLLVLDNCEHLVAETAALCAEVIRRCPQVRILATSRRRLGVTAEQVLPLAPFAEPGAVSPGKSQDPAAQLFIDRLVQVRPDVSTGETAAVQRLCRRLDGLPLAIELAAARAATLGVEEVVALLEEGAGGVLPGLDAVVDWSVRLLTPSQQRLLALVSVIAGEFDRETADALVGRMTQTAGIPEVAADLAELVEAQLLVRLPTDVEAPSYRMLAIVRSRARTLLVESGQETAARSAHARWLSARLRRGAHEWSAGGTVAAGRHLRAQVPDLAAALRWALETERLEVAADLAVALRLHMHWVADVALSDLVIEVAETCARSPEECRAPGEAAGALACAERGLIDRAQQLGRCALQGEPTVQARVLAGVAMAVSSMYSGQLEEAARWARTVIDDPDAPAGHRADLRVTFALAATYSRDLAAARAATDLALHGAQAAGAEAAYAFALYADGELSAPTSPEHGAARFRDAARRADRIDAQHISQVSRLALFAVLVRRRQHEEALDLALPLLQDARRTGAWPQVWTLVRLLAELLMGQGRYADAALLLGAADAAEGAPPLIAADVERGVAGKLRTALREEVLRGITEVGAGLNRAQVMARALALLTEHTHRPA